MRETIAIVALGLVFGVWGCDRGGGEAEGQESEHSHAHGDEEGHAHEGGQGHAHEGEGGHAHEEEEGHHEGGGGHHQGEEGHHEKGHAHAGEEDHHEGEEGHHDGGEEGHQHGDEEGHEHADPNYKKKGTVEVPKGGKEFEPAVAVDRLPKGAWYCDMGKAPWAAMEKPNDGCPIEGAPLKQVSQ